MKNIILTLCTIIISLSAYAHGALIKGTVSDSLANTVIPGATIVLNDKQEITTTDQLGNFKFDCLSTGAYSLRISFIGYETKTYSVTVSESDTKMITVQLNPTSINISEVSVVGAKSLEQTMTTINKIDLELRPTKSSQDILRIIPGVVTAQHAGGGKAEQIFLRGFDCDHGTDIRVSVDDMPVNMVSHAHGQGYADLHFVTPEIIDYVDFGKGPYYTRQGDLNTAGYANFHTKNGLENSSFKIEGGSFDLVRAVGLFDLLDKKNTAKNQSAYLAAEYMFTNGPFENPQNFNRINLFGKYHGVIGDNKIFTATISTFKSEWDASGQIPQRALDNHIINRFGALDNTEGGVTSRSNANFSLTKINEDGSSFRNQVYLVNYNFELYSNFTYFANDSVNGDEIKQKEKRNIYGYNGAYNQTFNLGIKKIQTEFGAGIRYDDINNDELTHVKKRYTVINPVSLGDVDEINANVYADAVLNVSDDFKINAGVRYDQFEFQYSDKLDSLYSRQTASKGAISPKLNFYYNFTENFQLYLKSGIGFHSNDARVVIPQNGADILPAAYGTDFGAYIKPTKNLLLNVAIWQLYLQQEFVYVGDESVVEPSGKTQRFGADLSIRWQLVNWLYFDADLTLAKGRSVDDPEGQNYIPLAPTVTSIAGLTARTKKGFGASLRYRYVGDRPANEDNSVTAKGYFLLDGGLNYSSKRFDIGLSFENILNTEWNEAQFDTETRLEGEPENISELCFTPGNPFNLKAGITYKF
ncbi:MAG: TonB-dependent receptor [Bacteroidia bacterium]